MEPDCLIVLTGAMNGKKYPLEAEITIGRNPDSTIFLDDMQVSRRHAKVELTPQGAILRDLGSGNGTYVGNRRILEHQLADGEIIVIGKQQLQYKKAESQESEQEAAAGGVMRSEQDSAFEASDAKNIYQTFFRAPSQATNESQLREIQRRLAAVYAANQAIASEQDINAVFDRIMEQVFSLLSVSNGVIMLARADGGGLDVAFVRSAKDTQNVHVSQTIVRRAFDNDEALITCNALDDSRFRSGMSILAQNITSAMCAPLTHQDERLGVIYVDNHGLTNAFKNSDLELLVALAAPAATAIKNAQYVRMLRQSYEDTLTVLANAIELRDHYTVGHTWRVTNFAMAIARELGWNEEKIHEVQMGGVLHDVGKIAVDNAILGKAGRLTEEEFAQMRVHPERGADLLRDVKFLRPLIPYCLYHHERWDGTGYPHGLKGEEIPIEGRLVAVADAFDAMTSNRPYRRGMDPQAALKLLVDGRGTQFDATVVDALLAAFKKGKITEVLQDYFKNESRSLVCPFCSTFIRLGPDMKAGSEFECAVCHRTIRVLEFEGGFHGELVTQA